MSSSLLRRLRELNSGLAATPPLPSGRLHEIVEAVGDALETWDADSPQAEDIKSEVITLGERLRFEASRLGEHDRRSGAVDALMHAACVVLPRGAHVVAQMTTPGPDGFRLASACHLFFTEGVVLLRALRMRLMSSTPVAGDPSARVWHFNSQRQLAAVAMVVTILLRPGSQPQAAAAFAGSTARPSALLPWLAEVTAAFQWTGPVVATGPAVPNEGLSGWAPSDNSVLNYGNLVHYMLTTPPYARQAAALASNPAQQQAVTDVLLRRCLPHAAGKLRQDPGKAGWVVTARTVSALLVSDSLRTAVAREMRHPGTCVHIVQAAASLAAALPAAPFAGMPAGLFVDAHEQASRLLATLCDLLLPPLPPGSGAAGVYTAGGSGSTAGSTAGSAAGGTAAGSTGGGNSAAGGGVAASSQGGPVAAGSKGWQAVAAALLQVLPHQLAVLQVLACDFECPEESLAGMCHSVSVTLEIVLGTLGGQALVTPAQLPMWAAAAEAAIRLQPLLAQLHGRQWEEAGKGAQVVRRLSEALLQNLWYGMPAGSWQLVGEPNAASFGSLWQLHSAACRLLHWLAAGDGDLVQVLAACGGPPGAHDWHRLLEGLHRLYYVLNACCIAGEQLDQTAQQRAARQRHERTLSAGHWAATQACLRAAAAELAAAAEGAAAGSGLHQRSAGCQAAATAAQHAATVKAVSNIAMAFPSLIGPGLVGVMEEALTALAQAVNTRAGSAQARLAASEMFSALWDTVVAAAHQPRLAAVVAARAGIASAEHGACSVQLAGVWRDFKAADDPAMLLGPCYLKAAQTLVEAGIGASSSLRATTGRRSSTGEGEGGAGAAPGVAGASSQQQPGSELAAQLEAAADHLQQLLSQAGQQQGSRSGSGGSDVHSTGGEQQQGSGSPIHSQKLEWMQQLLAQPAAVLAVLVQAYWQLPEQQAAAALELAQAGAARSCAYLRCANVALLGGPGEGEGQGCKRCSGCRAARYCSTACSHADWRGGHRRVCKQLATTTAVAVVEGDAAAGGSSR